MVPVGDILILDSTNKGACFGVLMGVWRNGLEGVKRERMIRRVDVRREKARGRNQFLFFCCALVVLPSISAVQETFRERESARKWVDEREGFKSGGGGNGMVRWCTTGVLEFFFLIRPEY